MPAEMGELRQALVMTGAGHSLQATGILSHRPFTKWLASWETVVKEKLGKEQSDAALDEGRRLSPTDAVEVTIGWLEGR